MLTEGVRFGRYRVGRRLGRGGMGEVWEAELQGPEGFRRRVALKVLHGGGGDASRRLVHEARLGALVSHPNVVATYDLGRVEDRWYVAMELVRGPSVSSLVGRPQPAVRVVDLGLQVLAGLDHVHALEVDGRRVGLVHRDIKPGNLLLDPSGLVKIADLGIARFASEADASIGTPGYCPAEQLAGTEDGRADLFALAVALHTLAVGQEPFGRDVAALTRVMRSDRIVLAPAFRERLDAAVPGLGSVVVRALRTDPAERWPDARAMAAALHEVQRGLGLQARLGPRPTSAPPEVAIEDAPTVPTQLPLIGRDAELADLGARIRRPGVVSVVGPGGMGKTRLARQAAALADLPFVIVDLTEASSPIGVASALARAVGIPLVDADVQRQLGAALASRKGTLWLLDNAEQVSALLRPMLEAWRLDAPQSRFLVTSRVPLGLPDEVVVPLGPLPVEAGVRLFSERAPVALSSEDLRRVRALIPELDGMPLAIELAAARTRLLTVEQLAARLTDRFRVLSASDDQVSRRHRSLLASLESTWELMSEDARATLQALATLVGAFGLSVAERLLPSGPDDPWALDRLEVLASHGLLHRQGDRFRLLVSVRDHAARKTHPLVRERLEELHARLFASVPPDTSPTVMAVDLANLVVAARRMLDRGRFDLAELLARLVWTTVEARGPTQVGVELLDRLLAEAPADRRAAILAMVIHARLHERRLDGIDASLAELAALPDHRPVDLLFLRARLSEGRQLDGEAAALFEEAVRAADAVGDWEIAAKCRCSLALYLNDRSRPDEALRWIAEARTPVTTRTATSLFVADLVIRRTNDRPVGDDEIAILRERIDHTDHLPTRLTLLTALRMTAGRRDLEAGLAIGLEGYELTVSAGLVHRQHIAAANLALYLTELGRGEEALRYLDEADEACRRARVTDWSAHDLSRAMALWALGRVSEAEALVRARLARKADGLFRVLDHATLGGLLLDQGRRAEAREQLDLAASLPSRLAPHVRVIRADLDAHDGRLDEVRATLREIGTDGQDPANQTRLDALAAWVARAEGDGATEDAAWARALGRGRPGTHAARILERFAKLLDRPPPLWPT